MTTLFERFFPTDPDVENIAVHAFQAALIDYGTGYTTRLQITNHWSLDSESAAQLDVLCDAVDGMAAMQKVVFASELHAVLLIASAGVKYTTEEPFHARLGFGS